MNVASKPDSQSRQMSAGYPVLLVGALQPHLGKTSLAAAIALTLAYEGRRVLALRLAGDENDRDAARADAAYFRTMPFARGRGGGPVDLTAALQSAREQDQTGGLLVLEASAGADLADLAGQLNAGVIMPVRAADAAALQALGRLSAALGARLLGVVALAVPAALVEAARAALSDGPAPLLGVLPEDGTLYAPSVLELAEALDAEVVLGEPDESQIIEHLMIGPITTDPGQPYYSRPRSKRAVITRSDKTDLQLAAMHSDIDCLILTGGYPPSPYTIDRAADSEISVLLTRADTRGTVERLEDIFLTTRFAGEQKLERMRALLEQHLDWARLRQALCAD